MSYYNTTSLTGHDLRAAIAAARRQEDAVLAIYDAAGRPLGPSDVLRVCVAAGKSWPLTSVRRAIHSLTGDDKPLEQLDALQTGSYGKPEHLWQRKRGQAELFGVAA